MELTNEFTVGVPVDQAWQVLTDVERIAPCMPGAQLQEVEGDEYRGVVKVKVGPITAQYKGKANFVEKDDTTHRAVLKAEGRETRGQGNASATITATLVPAGDGTQVTVVTDLTVTGRVAQFGRGVLADVSAKLLGQFVSCLETTVLAGDGQAAPASEEPATDEAASWSAASASPAPAAAAGSAASATGAGDGSAPTLAATDTGPVVPDAGAPEAGGPAETAIPGETGAVTVPPLRGEPAVAEGNPVEATATAPSATGTVTATATGPVDAGPTGAGTGTAPSAPASSDGVRRVDHPEAEPVDLLGVAGAPVGRRVAPLVGALAALLVFLRLRRWRKRR